MGPSLPRKMLGEWQLNVYPNGGRFPAAEPRPGGTRRSLRVTPDRPVGRWPSLILLVSHVGGNFCPGVHHGRPHSPGRTVPPRSSLSPAPSSSCCGLGGPRGRGVGAGVWLRGPGARARGSPSPRDSGRAAPPLLESKPKPSPGSGRGLSARDPRAEPRSQASKDRHQEPPWHRLVGLGTPASFRFEDSGTLRNPERLNRGSRRPRSDRPHSVPFCQVAVTALGSHAGAAASSSSGSGAGGGDRDGSASALGRPAPCARRSLDWVMV
ncbi:uncharacterized protein LOC121817913 [Ovis aries]|uniref:uncharacterized protein LOC121817913 n=1 Tax=Ovis aries TaxID=9940 RepID=UPI001C2E9C1F|nr:uncharacterized protein LOC121817913 [Ovis aries]